MKLIKYITFQYKVIKTNNGIHGKPLPNMVQYFLTDNNNNYLSFWNDIPLGL
jgi:hypothetical protein